MKNVSALVVTFVCTISVSAWAADVVVYKDANCGCCKKWVEHLRRNGLTVDAKDVTNLNAHKSGVPGELQACHTAMVDGYIVEGHVPASDIRRLLQERPKVSGLAVPGMPAGSPGMEGPTTQNYDVLTFDQGGKTSVYARH